MMEFLPDDDETPTTAAEPFVTVESSVEVLPPARPPEPVTDEASALPVALVFASRREGGTPHVVSVLDLRDGKALTCTCAAIRNLAYRPRGCHAMQRARIMLGMPEP